MFLPCWRRLSFFVYVHLHLSRDFAYTKVWGGIPGRLCRDVLSVGFNNSTSTTFPVFTGEESSRIFYLERLVCLLSADAPSENAK